MSAEQITELETRLEAAGKTVATLTQENAQLAGKLSDAELLIRKLKRSSRRDESNFRDQLSAARDRRR